MAAPEAPVLYQGVSRTSAAFRLLQQMGWHEGEGLGREKQGITEHLRVSKKSDNSGLGVDPQMKAANNWTFNTSVFDNILKNLKVIAADADEAVQTQQKSAHAWTATKEDLKKTTRPQGRYKRRELGKAIQGKSQADLEAILGWRGMSSGGTQLGERHKNNSESVSSNRAPEVHCGIGVSSDKIVEENKTIVTREHLSVMKPVEMVKGIPTEKLSGDWWGAKHGFVQGGLLGGTPFSNIEGKKETKSDKIGDPAFEESRSACRASFCEQDQEELCKIVQEKATKGRQGLGIASRPKKIGGAYWKGKKVILSTTADQDNFRTQDEGLVDLDATCNRAAQKRKAVLVESSEREVQEISNRKRKKGKNKIKWRCVCEQLLQEAPAQTMSIKDLHKQIAAISDLFSSNNTHHIENGTPSFKEKLKSSSKFIVEGKKVSLACSKGSSSICF